MAWELTAGLANLRSQVNARWPNRDHASDGTIGDTAHQQETSGHNPDDTAGSKPEWNGDSDSRQEVRAWDMDDDLGEPGTTAQMLVDHFRVLPGFNTVNRYMIYNRFIYRASTGYAKEDYTGASAHTEHIHFSGAYTQASDNNTTFDYKLEEVGDMALSAADVKTLANTDNVFRAPEGSKNADGTPNEYWSLASYVINTYNNAVSAKTYASQALATAQQALAAVKALADPAAIAAAVVAALPADTDDIDQDEVTRAVKAAFTEAFTQDPA